jgi:hypothetical protein
LIHLTSHDKVSVAPAWRKALDFHGVRVVCLRIGLVQGTDGGFIARMLPPFQFGFWRAKSWRGRSKCGAAFNPAAQCSLAGSCGRSWSGQVKEEILRFGASCKFDAPSIVVETS